jgi:hypothetical protein
LGAFPCFFASGKKTGKPGYPLQFLKTPSAFLRDFRFYPLRAYYPRMVLLRKTMRAASILKTPLSIVYSEMEKKPPPPGKSRQEKP